MNVLLDRLVRILKYEQQQGYRNHAVSGGLAALIAGWGREARAHLPERMHPALDEICGALKAYGALEGVPARAQAVQALLERAQTLSAEMPDESQGDRTAQPAGGPRVRPEGPATTRTPPAPAPPEEPPALAAPPAAPPTAPLADDELESEPPEGERAGPEEPAEPAEGAETTQPRPPFGAADRPRPAPGAARAPAASPTPGLGLYASVTTIRGIGPAQAKRLEALGVETIGDMLLLLPRRYDDYSRLKPINRLSLGEEVTIIGTIWETHARRGKNGQMITRTIVSDGSGTLEATWFNQPWLAEKLEAGTQLVLSGKITQYLGRLAMQSPEWEPLERETLHTNRIVPVYPLTQGLTPRWLRKLMKRVVDYWAPRVADPVPPAVRDRLGLLDRPTAVAQAHFPDDHDLLRAARRRLSFDELFLLQIGLWRQRREWQAAPGVPLPVSDDWIARFAAALPFALTGAQQRAVDQIRRDLAPAADGRAPVPMNRLLQGDVGSGKTAVAAAGLAMAAANGWQGVIMVPTEILAEQHYKALHKLLVENEALRDLAGMAAPAELPAGPLALLTGSTPAAEREAIYAGLADGTVRIAVGTHALIQPGVRFARLAFAVVDEQHRFGVAQRAALRQKGVTPHVLVMTATPIPRTLELTLYGDLDVTRLDEMPPGRQPITTRVLYPRERERAYGFIRKQVAEGRQAFVICALVEESDKIDARAAVAEHARLQQEIFPDLRVGLVHGRMRPDEKETAMAAFYHGEYDVLVSTAVIEVGIDVPNATVMMIEGANRFGLAQLHQFRGRVGRGAHASYCILLSDAPDDPAENERLVAIQDTQDGFVLAEKDLELRGPGQLLGTLQSGTGLPSLRMSETLDYATMAATRQEVEALFAADPDLSAPANQALAQQAARFWERGGIDIS